MVTKEFILGCLGSMQFIETAKRTLPVFVLVCVLRTSALDKILNVMEDIVGNHL